MFFERKKESKIILPFRKRRRKKNVKMEGETDRYGGKEKETKTKKERQ